MSQISISLKSKLLITGAIIGGLTLSDAAFAQQAPDEIIVTGRKKAETVMQAPIAITAFSAENLESAGIQDLRQVADFTPGLQLSSDLGRNSERPVIRGVANARAETPQPVSVFVDGIYIRRGITSTLIDNVERIEVLKGPQSALYGRSTYGGVVNYITRTPGEEIGGKLVLEAATHDEYRISGFVDGPLNESGTIRGTLGGKYSEYGGGFDNTALLQDGRDVGSEQTTAVYGKLYFEPTDNFSAQLSMNYSEDRDGIFAGQLIEGPYNSLDADSPCPNVTRIAFCGTIQAPDEINITTGYPEGTLIPTDAGPQQTFGEYDTGLDRDIFRLGANLKYETDSGYTIESLTGYTDEKLDFRVNEGYSDVLLSAPFGGVLGWASFDKGGREDFYQEVRVSSPTDGMFEWLVGGIYYENEQYNEDRDINQAEFTPDSTEKEAEKAVFARLGVNLSEQLSLGFEGRYYEEEVEQISSFFGGTDRKATFDGFSPRVTIDYQVTPDTLIYALAARGNKRGGFNDLRAPEPFDTFREEIVKSYEVGFKTRLVENLRLEVAGYFNDLTDQQLSRLAIFDEGTPDQIQVTIVDNIGATEIWGVEVDARYDFSDNFYVRGTYALADTKITEGEDDTQAGFFGGDGSLVGFKVPRVAENTATLTMEYSDAFGNSEKTWYVRADGIYSDGRYMSVQNIVKTPSATTLNVRAGIKSDNWDFSLYGKNITDEDAPTNAFRYVGLRDFANGATSANQNFFRRGNNVAFLRRGAQVGARFIYDF
ncbi:outer membrane receptor protein involved in Fe transport [Litorimonas taeanensis]|uniref:Outer membrane receptor protein involved in Fe transport n=1 Tax=Litorimonas taeanensis TaxID=568099 RepID=A0A420WLW4_9PROT|nr:TonB-dependent receptor [Litorimonas taeanensis]RKQ71970.1 outer membrane receptor protein involved in Fe transport [Litorimonas taeanensis]